MQLLGEVALRARRFEPSAKARVVALYDELYRRYTAAATQGERDAAVVAFLSGVQEFPQLQEVLDWARQREPDTPPTGEPAIALPPRLEELEPHTAAAAPRRAEPPSAPTRSAPSAASRSAEAPSAPTRSMRKKNGGTRAAPSREAESAPAPATEGARPPLTRYPELDVQSRVALGQRTSITAGLHIDNPDGLLNRVTISIEDSADAPPMLELVLRAPGFEIEGSNTQELTVAADRDVEARFTVRAVREGPATVRVDFYQRGRRIGTVAATTTVGAAPEVAREAIPAEPLEFASSLAPCADLDLYIGVDNQDSLHLTFTLSSASETINLHHAPMGSVRLQRAPLAEMELVYAELSRFARGRPDSAAKVEAQRKRLATLGNELWERLVSQELKDSYWRWKDQVRSIQITSEEPWIPWEMVKPFRFDAQNKREDEPHLCERFAVARWLAGTGPADRIPVHQLQPVASQSVDLAAVSAELKAFGQLVSLRPNLEALAQVAETAQLIDSFERGTFSVLHVAAHGGFDATLPDDSGIVLTDGNVRPSDINARFGQARPRPIVFINACHGTRQEYAFTGLGGWADRLVRQAHVGAFVGAAWEVSDRLALLFAERFYAAFLGQGKTIGESVRSAREAIRVAEPSNSTWLAYVLYGDPTATASAPR